LEKGRVTIPYRLRSRLGLKKGDKIEFSLEGNMIHLIIPKLGGDAVGRTKGALRLTEHVIYPSGEQSTDTREELRPQHHHPDA